MAIGAAAAGFTSCGDDYEDYQWAPVPDGQEVYFARTLSSTITLSSLENSFSIPVMRIDGTEAISVSITATADDEETVLEAFTFPSTVNFAAGETETTINVTYDFDMIDFDNTQSITVKIADESVDNTYGLGTYSFKATCPAPWTSLGNGTFTEKWWFNTTSTVTFYQNDLDPTVFRVTNPFAKQNGSDEFFEFRLLQVGQTVYKVTITQPGLVAFDDFFLETHSSYNDDLYMMFPGRFTSMASEDKWSGNYVVSYQDNGLPAEIRLSPCYYMFNTGGWTNMLTAENVQIVFPGVQLLDTSVSVTYNGLFRSAEEESSVIASVTLGEDVELAKVAVVQGGDPSIGAKDVISGMVESVEVTESGIVKIPFDLDNIESRYSIVVVSYCDGEAKENAGAVFKYNPARPEKWNLIGKGTYKYEHYWEGDEEDLEIYQSENDPTRYKITKWSTDGGDLMFTMDANGKITVLEQETGEVDDTYGMVSIDELRNYTGDANEEQSYFENGVYHFNVVYYVGAGEFGAGFETFTLSKNTSKSRTNNSYRTNKTATLTHNYSLDTTTRLN